MSYSYIIYKIYNWTANKPSGTPVFTTVLILATVHMFQFLTFFLYLNAFFLHINHVNNFSNGYVFVGALAWLGILHLIIYKKERWSRYIQQYQGEDEHESKIGNYKVMAFCILSILAFFVSLPISFTLLSASISK